MEKESVYSLIEPYSKGQFLHAKIKRSVFKILNIDIYFIYHTKLLFGTVVNRALPYLLGHSKLRSQFL